MRFQKRDKAYRDRFETLFRLWPQGLIGLSADDLIITLSDQALAVLGTERAFFVGRHVHEAICALARDHSHTHADCPLLTPTPEHEQVTGLWQTAAGEQVSVDYRVFELGHDADISKVIIFENNHEKPYSREDYDRFSQYVDASPAALCELDQEGQLLWCNNAMNAVLLEHGFDHFGLANVFPRNLENHCTRCWQEQVEVNHVEIKVGSHWFSWHFQPMSARGYPSVLGYVFDITAQKNAQLQLAADKAEARRDFFAKMIHELRTPLNAIIGMSQVVLKRSQGQLSTEDEKSINAIRVAGLQLHDMVTDTLDISKIDAGKMELRLETVQLNSVFESFYDQVNTIAEAKALKFKIVCEKNLTLKTDALKIRQVLVNLISNAIKYTQEGSVHVKAEKRKDKQLGQIVMLQVSDTGIGIPPEQLKKLFKAYHQVTEERNKGIQGTGLGLVLVSEVVKLLGGEIHVDSEIDKGSTFTVIFAVE